MKNYLFIILILFFPLKSYSHVGGLNKSGCHKNSGTGDYHCHRDNKNKKSNLNLNGIKLNEDYFNKWLANKLNGQTEVSFKYNYNPKDTSPLVASVRVDIVTDEYVIEGGLDKRSSLDTI